MVRRVAPLGRRCVKEVGIWATKCVGWADDVLKEGYGGLLSVRMPIGVNWACPSCW